MRTIVVDNNVAYAYGLQRMSGTKTDREKVELWFRATAFTCITPPFAMDGSERALLDNLKP
jgi:hypothetical protein